MTSISPIRQSIPPSTRPARNVPLAVNRAEQSGHHHEEDPQTTQDRKTNNDGLVNKTRTQLTEEELKQLRELKQRDREVRTHEQAHLAAAGSLAKGGPSFKFQRGPDGQQYAVGGEVNIDISAEPGDPKATIEKAQRIRRAALAPANPSAQDRSVAAAATRIESEARAELAQQSESDKTGHQNQTHNTQAMNTTEIASKCAECGGQHTADSHDKAIQLRLNFSSGEQSGRKTLLNLNA